MTKGPIRLQKVGGLLPGGGRAGVQTPQTMVGGPAGCAAQASGAIGKDGAYTPVPFKPWCAKDSVRGLVKNADSD